jgi:hypothetical protein
LLSNRYPESIAIEKGAFMLDVTFEKEITGIYKIVVSGIAIYAQSRMITFSLIVNDVAVVMAHRAMIGFPEKWIIYLQRKEVNVLKEALLETSVLKVQVRHIEGNRCFGNPAVQLPGLGGERILSKLRGIDQ